jgi:hypothetical protein
MLEIKYFIKEVLVYSLIKIFSIKIFIVKILISRIFSNILFYDSSLY